MLFLGAFVLGIGEWLRFLLPGSQWARNVSMGPGPYSTQMVLLAPLLVLLAWSGPVGLARGIRVTLAAAAVLIVAGIAGGNRTLLGRLIVSAGGALSPVLGETPAPFPGRLAPRRAPLAAPPAPPPPLVVR